MKIFDYSLDSKYSVEKYEGAKEFQYIENGIKMPKYTDSLYKYLSWNEKTIASLLGNYLWLTNPVYFNDPFDCNRNIIFNYDFSEADRLNKRNYYDDVGILSFTENRFCPLMWAHYTGNYSGIVLKFKGESFNNLKD